MVMLTLFVATIMQAQQITCKGNIADVSGEPIIGASVVVKVPRKVQFPTWTVTSRSKPTPTQHWSYLI